MFQYQHSIRKQLVTPIIVRALVYQTVLLAQEVGIAACRPYRMEKKSWFSFSSILSSNVRASQQGEGFYHTSSLTALYPTMNVFFSNKFSSSSSSDHPRSMVTVCIILVASGAFLTNNSKLSRPHIALRYLFNNQRFLGSVLSTSLYVWF